MRLGDDLPAGWIWVKAGLFLLIGLLAAGAILLLHPQLEVALFLAAAIWAFCRLYYFLFYVVEHYLSPNFRYAGILDCLWQLRSPEGTEDKQCSDQ